MSPILVTFSIYIVGMLLIGYYYYRKNENISDYFLGGRSLNPYVTALSAQASDMSGWLLMGFPGAINAGGFNAMWIGNRLSSWNLFKLAVYGSEIKKIHRDSRFNNNS